MFVPIQPIINFKKIILPLFLMIFLLYNITDSDFFDKKIVDFEVIYKFATINKL